MQVLLYHPSTTTTVMMIEPPERRRRRRGSSSSCHTIRRRCSSHKKRTTRRIQSSFYLLFLAAAAVVIITISSLMGETTASALPALPSSTGATRRNAAADSPTAGFSRAVVLASATSTVVAPTTTTSTAEEVTTALAAEAAATATKESSSNAVVQVVVYLKNSVQRTVLGFGQLWSNHGRCNEIRKKIKLHQNKVRMQWEQQGLYDHENVVVAGSSKNSDNNNPRAMEQKLRTIIGGITYEEFIFLQKGKEDRSKVMTLGFIMFGAPKIFPYMLMFNQQMLPSPLVAPDHATKAGRAGHGESLVETKSRERTAVILKMLLQLEQDARVIPQLAQLNIFGRKQQLARMESIASLNAQGMNFLQTIGVKSTRTYSSSMSPTIASTSSSSSSSSSSPDATMDMTGGGGGGGYNYGARRLLNMLEPYLYQAGQDFDRASQRLCHVPASIVRGLGNAALGSGGVLDSFLPNIMARSRLLDHVQKVEAADDFIVHAKIDLTTISPRLLREACNDRLIGGPGCSSRELRLFLQEWLTLAVQVPEQRLKGGNSGTNKLYYNGNLARTALMGYYGLQAVQDSRCASVLPRLVFTGQHGNGGADGSAAAAGSMDHHGPSSSSANGFKGWGSWR